MEFSQWRESRTPTFNKQQQKFNHQLVANADVYIKSELLDTLRKLTGDICDLTPSDELCIINVDYSSICNDEYLSSGIKLEIGPLASMIPSTQRTIFGYVAETHQAQFQYGSCSVSVINAEITFWEKMLILHQEYYRPQGKPQPKGYLQHFYDVAKIAGDIVKNNALLDTKLREDVIAFKMKSFGPRVA